MMSSICCRCDSTSSSCLVRIVSISSSWADKLAANGCLAVGSVMKVHNGSSRHGPLKQIMMRQVNE